MFFISSFISIYSNGLIYSFNTLKIDPKNKVLFFLYPPFTLINYIKTYLSEQVDSVFGKFNIYILFQ